MSIKRCNRCGRPIAFVTGASGRPMAVDPDPIFAVPGIGPLTIIKIGGKVQKGKRAHRDDPGAVYAYIPHFTTCPRRLSQSDYRNRKTIPLPPRKRPKPKPQPPEREPEPQLPMVEQLSLIG